MTATHVTTELERIRVQKLLREREAAEQAERQAAHEVPDFFDWAQDYLPHHFPGDTPEFHDEMVDVIEGTDRAVFAAPRGHAKSTLVTVGYLLYRMAEFKEPYSLIVSDTNELATGHVANIVEELVENDDLLRDYPHLKLPDAADYKKKRLKRTARDIITMGGLRLTAISALARVRGLRKRATRPSLIIVDDLENDEAVESPDQRGKLWDWFTKALLNLFSATGGRMIVVGTVLHEESLLNRLLGRNPEARQGGRDDGAAWDRRFYQAIRPDGSLLWPSYWTVEKLNAKRYEIGPKAFATEYLNEPGDPESAMFKRDWIINALEMPKLRYKVIAVDPSVSRKGNRDACGIIAGGVAGRDLAIVKDATVYASPAVWARKVLDTYKEFGAHRIVAEGNQGGALITEALKAALLPDESLPPIEIVFASESKSARAEPLAVLYSQKRVRHFGVLTHYEDEITTWVPGSLSPNRLDAAVWLYKACERLLDTGGVDVDFMDNAMVPQYDPQRPESWSGMDEDALFAAGWGR